MTRRSWMLAAAGPAYLRASSPEPPLASRVTAGGVEFDPKQPPRALTLRRNLGLVTAPALEGQVVHTAAAGQHLYETRAVKTPGGDFLLMFPEGKHYGGADRTGKKNRLLAYRSTDGGKSWNGPTEPFLIDYSQHGFIPLIPRGTRRLYAFGTQPMDALREGNENCPIGLRWSDDAGRTWSGVSLIRPVNDPEFKGMSVMRMCETPSGAWLLGSHTADWSVKPLRTRQYVLRSADRGQTWRVLPGTRPAGWFAPERDRMDEGRPISIGGRNVFLMSRTPVGRLYGVWSRDDGQTWTTPVPTPLVHPDAPPMLFHLPDGQTLAAFHHNRFSDRQYTGLSAKPEVMKDRSELWVSLSADGGHHWTEPRFVLANALAETDSNAFYNYQCSYLDAFADGDLMHLFLPHRWARALHLTLPAAALTKLPTRAELQKS